MPWKFMCHQQLQHMLQQNQRMQRNDEIREQTNNIFQMQFYINSTNTHNNFNVPFNYNNFRAQTSPSTNVDINPPHNFNPTVPQNRTVPNDPTAPSTQLPYRPTFAHDRAGAYNPTLTNHTTVPPNHATIQPNPTIIQPNPTTIQPNPTIIQPNPTTTQPNPTIIQPNPTTIQPNPTTIQHNPTTIQPNPTTIQPNPTTIQPNPTTIQPNPTTIQHNHTTIPPNRTNQQPIANINSHLLQPRVSAQTTNNKAVQNVFTNIKRNNLSHMVQRQKTKATLNEWLHSQDVIVRCIEINKIIQRGETDFYIFLLNNDMLQSDEDDENDDEQSHVHRIEQKQEREHTDQHQQQTQERKENHHQFSNHHQQNEEVLNDHLLSNVMQDETNNALFSLNDSPHAQTPGAQTHSNRDEATVMQKPPPSIPSTFFWRKLSKSQS